MNLPREPYEKSDERPYRCFECGRSSYDDGDFVFNDDGYSYCPCCLPDDDEEEEIEDCQ